MPRYDAMSTLQKNVESALAEKGWSKQDFADKLGMDRSQLSKIIRGQNAATVKTLEHIAEGLGLKLYELFMPESSLQNISG